MKPVITKHTLQVDSSKTFCAVYIETSEGNASYGFFILTDLACTDRASEHSEIREYGYTLRYDDEGGEFASEELQEWVREKEPCKELAETTLKKAIGIIKQYNVYEKELSFDPNGEGLYEIHQGDCVGTITVENNEIESYDFPGGDDIRSDHMISECIGGEWDSLGGDTKWINENPCTHALTITEPGPDDDGEYPEVIYLLELADQ